MKKYLVRIMTCCAACAAMAVQAQTSQDTSSGATGTSGTGTSGSDSSTSSSQWKSRYSATGRMGQHEIRGSKLTGADVKTSSGESLGKIEDVVINAASGRIDFAVISYNSSGSSSSSSSSSSTSPSSTSSTSPSSTSSSSPSSASSTSPSSTSSTSPSTSTASSSGEKLVPVPFTMLRPQSMTGYGATSGTSSSTSATSSSSSSSSEQQPTFVFSGDKSRLENAPSFDRNSWPDLTQSDWRQRIFAHFGMQPGSATGGATTPGGTSTGTSSDSSSDSSKPDSSSTPK